MQNLQNIAVIGASGAIGRAFCEVVSSRHPQARLHAFSSQAQQDEYRLDYHCERSITQAAQRASQEQPLDLVLVATGQLHGDTVAPEKSLRDLSSENFAHIMHSNMVVPALVAKHFLPVLRRDQPSVFAALSARVGSISDNQMGGWYAYRASKAALNMVIKTAAIEVGRRNKQATIVGLHPGTVDSALSKPFQGNVPKGQLFTAEYSAGKMLDVLSGLSAEQSGRCFAWDGLEIVP